MEEVGEQCSDSTPKSLSSHHLWTADRKGGSENGDFQNGKKFSKVACMSSYGCDRMSSCAESHTCHAAAIVFTRGGTNSERRCWYREREESRVLIQYFSWRLPLSEALTCDATRYEAGKVVEGEGGLIHSFPHTCTL